MFRAVEENGENFNCSILNDITPTEVKYILLLLLAASSKRLSYSEAEMLSEASGSQERPRVIQRILSNLHYSRKITSSTHMLNTMLRQQRHWPRSLCRIASGQALCCSAISRSGSWEGRVDKFLCHIACTAVYLCALGPRLYFCKIFSDINPMKSKTEWVQCAEIRRNPPFAWILSQCMYYCVHVWLPVRGHFSIIGGNISAKEPLTAVSCTSFCSSLWLFGWLSELALLTVSACGPKLPRESSDQWSNGVVLV